MEFLKTLKELFKIVSSDTHKSHALTTWHLFYLQVLICVCVLAIQETL